MPTRTFTKAFLAAALLLVLPSFISAQTIVVDNETVPADEATVAPAAEQVDASSSAVAADLDTSETVQLTEDVLANLTSLELSNITLFAFQNDSDAAVIEKRSFFGRCKTYPGDPLWPSRMVWNVFDILLGGALIKTVPEASVCYRDYGNYDAAKCAHLTANWPNNSYLHIEDPTAINAVLFQGMTCMPPGIEPGATGCTLGGYPEYTVEVRHVAQIQLAVNLARSLNLRLVVKNTGHDFGAKSTGKGSLAVWTHRLKSARFFGDYREGAYRGPAFKLGAGLQVHEMYELADRHGVSLVGGEGETVGGMGGYVLGGGHSPLSSLYGMAADQVLSMQVVTADGRFVTASESANRDLFWALRGGGGSTFGVVTSVVVRARPRLARVTTLTYRLATGPNATADAFWRAMYAFFDGFPAYADRGHYSYFRIQRLGDGAFASDVGPWFAPGRSRAELEADVAPLLATFGRLGLAPEPVWGEFGSFRDAWRASFPLEPWGSTAVRQASRLFPRASWADAARRRATFDAIRSVVEAGAYLIAFNLKADRDPDGACPDNAVNPAWRETVLHAIMAVFLDGDGSEDGEDNEAARRRRSDTLTFDWMQRWRDVSPGAGAYMSESDYIEPDFQQAFFGSKYERLYELKKRYDPLGVFYAQNAVGSEDWEMSEMYLGNIPSQNSKLCRK